MTTTLTSILEVPELLDRVLEQSGTTQRMTRHYSPALGYTWKEYSIEEMSRRLRRQNLISVIQCLCRDLRICGLRWMNPHSMTMRVTIQIVPLRNVPLKITSDSDLDIIMDLDL